jgi:hypothetical protein
LRIIKRLNVYKTVAPYRALGKLEVGSGDGVKESVRLWVVSSGWLPQPTRTTNPHYLTGFHFVVFLRNGVVFPNAIFMRLGARNPVACIKWSLWLKLFRNLQYEYCNYN